MKYFKTALILQLCLILLIGCKHSNEFSPAVKDFEESNSAQRQISLFLYPSTIQMLNYSNDSSFKTLVKDVEKLKIVSFKTDSNGVKPTQLNYLITKIHKESFVDLMQMKQNNQRFSIFCKNENNKPKELLGIVYSEDNLMVIDLLGSIPLSALPSLLNGNIKITGLTSLLNSNKSQNQRRREHGKHTSDK